MPDLDFDSEVTPEYDKLMLMFKPAFDKNPWNPGDPPMVSFFAMIDMFRRAISSRYATQAYPTIGEDRDPGGTAPPTRT